MSSTALLWKIAWRNLWRRRARTVTLVSVIAFTYGFTLLGMGMGDDSHRKMLEEARLAAGGDVLVHGDEYWLTWAGDIVMEDGPGVLDIVRGTEGVDQAFPRVIVSGLLSTSAASRPVFFQGVRPELEAPWRGLLDEVSTGTFLEEERDDPLVLGAGLVEKLELELGDRVVLTASGPDGEVARALFHLTGVLETGLREMDESLAYTTVRAAQAAVGMESGLTQIGVVVEAGARPARVAASLRDALRTHPDTLEVLTWREAVPEMVGFVELDDAFGYIYLAIIFAVVLFAITNTFLMAVMERVRELGLLSALGLKGRRIGVLILVETFLLTAVAMTVGFALGFGGHLAVDHWGLSLALWGVDELEIAGVDMADMVIHSHLDPLKWTAASVLVAGASVASALYPAWRAARLAPAEAMRFFE